MENREELEPIASNKPDENQNSCNVTRKGTKRKISQIVEQMDFTGKGYYHGPSTILNGRPISCLIIVCFRPF